MVAKSGADQQSGFRGSGFKVQGLGFRALGLGFIIVGLSLKSLGLEDWGPGVNMKLDFGVDCPWSGAYL